MTKSKRFVANQQQVDRESFYSPNQVLSKIRSMQNAKFDESLECHFRLGIDPRHADQQLRGTMNLEHGTGKKIKVAIMCEEADSAKLLGLGCEVAGEQAVIEKIESGSLDFDVLLTTPKMMPKLGRYAKVLGPKGLMPSPKNGRISTDLEKLFNDFVKGKVEYRNDKNGIVHLVIGKLSFTDQQLVENFDQVYELLMKLKPAKAKGIYMKSISLTTTMGPGFFVETQKTRWKEMDS